MKGSGKVSRRVRYLALSLAIAFPVSFGILQIWAVLEVPHEWYGEPAFWAGAIVWGAVGFFLPELDSWFTKKSRMAGLVFGLTIIILADLAMTRKFPTLFQFVMWGGLTGVTGFVRGWVERARTRKDHSQKDPPKED